MDSVITYPADIAPTGIERTEKIDFHTKNKQNKPTDVGRIVLERQAGGKTFDPIGIRTPGVPINNQMH